MTESDENSLDREPNKLTAAIIRALNWAYDVVLAGGPGFDSVEQLAASYSKRGGSTRTQAESLVRWQVAKASAVGFVTGLPGLPAMPATIPANLSAVICLQLRMAAAVAVLAGYDAKDDQVRSFATVCLAGGGANEVMRDLGIALSMKVSQKMVQNVSGKTLTAINQKVGFRLATKFGAKGFINLGKVVPLIGGVVGGTFDGVSTRAVGRTAIKVFIED